MSGSRSSGSIAHPDPGCESSEGEAASHGSPAPRIGVEFASGIRWTRRRVRRRMDDTKAKIREECITTVRSGERPDWTRMMIPPRPGSLASSEEFCSCEEEAMKERPAKGAESMGTQEAAEKSSSASPAAPYSTRPSARPRFPPYPTTGKKKDLLKWQQECRDIRAILAADPDNDLPTRRGPKDIDTARAVYSPAEKMMVLHAARSIVSVSSARHDGFRGARCTGIIIAKWEEPDADSHQSFLVVTSSKIVCMDQKVLDPIPKLSVVLPNAETISDVHLLRVIDHYEIAILSVSLYYPLELPSIGRGPEYGQEVFVLVRDREASLIARRGEIKWLEESDYLGRNYYMFLNCTLPKGGNGGQLIDHDGNTIGMTFYLNPYPAVLSISTITMCVDMHTEFNRIARPILDLGLRTVAFLDVERQEVISRYGISRGLIVDMVPYDSDAEKLGIRRGNVIVSLDGQENLTLPQLEDYLLSLGLGCLQGNKSDSTIQLMVRVRDLNEDSARSFPLPVALG